jgi:hypothetical protein
MKTLYVFGDSYSTPYFCVDPQDSFWGLLATDLKVDRILNYSHSGYALDQIIHLLCNESFDYNDSYFIIGIPPIARLALFLESKNLTQWPCSKFDTGFNQTLQKAQSVSGTQHSDFFEVFKEEKYFMANYNHSWQETITCDKISMIYDMLTMRNAKFVIVNLTAPIEYEDKWPVSKNVMMRLNNLKECILFKDTIHSVNQIDKIKPADWKKENGWFGHHGPIGNKNWYIKILKPLAEELKWL